MGSLFGPSRDEVWQKLARRVGGRFEDGGWLEGSQVEVDHEEWTVTLDSYAKSAGLSQTTYTRLRAPYVQGDGFRFTIYRASLFGHLGKLVGMQDVEVGHPAFDEDFIIQGNDAAKLRELLADPTVRDLVEAQPRIRLSVRDDEGWFGTRFPDGVDELRFDSVGLIKDIHRLEQAFDLFAAVLDRLCRIGSARPDDPGVDLE